ncbi:hypothetical protein [Owenweeksia hongkongensis]|uniref:hypothetical protein n=1 Tax=Owenweeksia hongkongensis TaxID=253245 RepID=UPI003A955F4C
MEIKPHVGFKDIKFGLSKSQIIEFLGEPDSEDTSNFEDGSSDIAMVYNELGVTLVFSSEDDFKLSSVTFYTSDATLMGEQFIGKSEEFLLETAKEKGIDDLFLDDDFEELEAKDYASEKLGLAFWVQQGVLDSITIFPEYDAQGEEILWPE